MFKEENPILKKMNFYIREMKQKSHVKLIVKVDSFQSLTNGKKIILKYCVYLVTNRDNIGF